MAAVLAGGDGAVLVCRSAAALHGFAADDSRRVHVSAHRRSRAELCFHRLDLAQSEITSMRGIPTTTVSRTLLDLATQTNDWHLERALREALYKNQSNLPTLSRVVSRHRGHRGAARLTGAIEQAQDAPGTFRSNPEQRFARWLRTHGLPRPEFNVELHVGDVRFEVDCYWRDHALVAEIDHRSTHARRRSFEADRIRDRTLQAHGVSVIRISEPYDSALQADLVRLLSQPL